MTCRMEARGRRPGPDAPATAEVVHESERARVTRHFLLDRRVIRKEPLGPDAGRRVRHEVAMLERLRGAPGVVQLAEAPECPGSVVLEDAGGTSLAGQGMGGIHALPGLQPRRPQAALHHQQHQEPELPAAQGHQGPRPLPVRRCRGQAAVGSPSSTSRTSGPASAPPAGRKPASARTSPPGSSRASVSWAAAKR